jgi:hypothetical protein
MGEGQAENQVGLVHPELADFVWKTCLVRVKQ